MSVARRWVFPIIWMVLAAVIATALVKIAFFPDRTVADPVVPGAEITDPQYVVTRGSIVNEVLADGTVSADAAVPVPATGAGEVRELYVGPGAWVAAGQEILLIKGQEPNADGTVGTVWSTVTAPITGVLTSFPTLVGQTFSVGQAVGQISPPGFHVSASIPAEQLYRLLDKPTEAQVTITGGPAPFTCTGLVISTGTPSQGGGQGTGGGDGTGGSGGTSGPTVSCAVPADVTVFPGLTAKLSIPGGTADDVLVVPTTAVEGASGTGTVYLVLADGTTEPRTVTLGLSDGVSVAVTEGLDEGDTILQFVPGAPATDGMPSGPIIVGSK